MRQGGRNDGRAGTSRLRALVVLCALVFLTACGKTTLVDNTTQKRAMQIVVALYKHGVSASTVRESGGQGKYRVEVDKNNYAQALAAIENDGLLDEPAPSFEDLTAPSSFFPASREVEALRMDYALGLEIKRILEEMSGIQHAQVMVRKRFGSREETIPSVSILLKVDAGISVDPQVVRELAQRSVPGLDPERVFISVDQTVPGTISEEAAGALNTQGKISYVPLVPFVFHWRVPKDDYTGFALLFLACIFLIGLVSVGFGYALGQIRGRRVRSAENGDVSSTINRIDRSRRDLLEG